MDTREFIGNIKVTIMSLPDFITLPTALKRNWQPFLLHNQTLTSLSEMVTLILPINSRVSIASLSYKEQGHESVSSAPACTVMLREEVNVRQNKSVFTASGISSDS